MHEETDVEFTERLVERKRGSEPFVVATIVSARGSTPRKVGAKMIVRGNGAIDFTLGGGPFEALVIEDAKAAIASGASDLKCYRFLPVGENATGMTCGGEVEVFLDVYRQPPRVVIFGAGHVALPLARLAKSTGFRVAVIDDRREWANRERFPEADDVVFAEGGYVRTDVPMEEDDYVVIVTRCHQTDEACIRRVLEDDREPAYVGVVASKRKAKVLLATLARDGFDRARLDSIRSPVGLDIGAETPEEIAVSILGEIIATARGRDARPMSTETQVPANVTVQRAPRPAKSATSRS
jgi:xanthine dehydrogenase accessory factor